MAGILKHPPANLGWYLWAELVSIPFFLCSAWAFGVYSVAYAVVYCLLTALIFLTIARLAWDCLESRRYRFRALGVALTFSIVLTRIAFIGISKPFSGYLVISLAEGLILAWAGILAVFTAPYTRRPDLTFPLGALWLGQACYRLGWALNFSVWQEINWVIPPMLGLACYSFLAWRLGQRAAVEHLS
jgi:hypothetical protein